jgi:hypothetical protein
MADWVEAHSESTLDVVLVHGSLFPYFYPLLQYFGSITPFPLHHHRRNHALHGWRPGQCLTSSFGAAFAHLYNTPHILKVEDQPQRRPNGRQRWTYGSDCGRIFCEEYICIQNTAPVCRLQVTNQTQQYHISHSNLPIIYNVEHTSPLSLTVPIRCIALRFQD